MNRARSLFPGVIACAVVAAAAGFLGQHYGAPVLLFALLLGLAMNFLSGDGAPCAPGIEFCARTVLRIGVALLGLRITVEQVMALGWGPVVLVVASVAITITLSMVVARALGFQSLFGLLTGGATAICGASARAGAVGGPAGAPAEGTRDAVHRDRRLGAVDLRDGGLPDDRAGARPQPAASRHLPRRHDPRRGAGGGRGLQPVAGNRRCRHAGEAVARGHAAAGDRGGRDDHARTQLPPTAPAKASGRRCCPASRWRSRCWWPSTAPAGCPSR